MAGQEKQFSGSPFIAAGQLVTGEASPTRIRAVATGGGAFQVALFDQDAAHAPIDMITLDAGVGAPDEYVAAGDRKLRFLYGISMSITGGAGKLYIYFT